MTILKKSKGLRKNKPKRKPKSKETIKKKQGKNKLVIDKETNFCLFSKMYKN